MLLFKKFSDPDFQGYLSFRCNTRKIQNFSFVLNDVMSSSYYFLASRASERSELARGASFSFLFCFCYNVPVEKL